VQDGVAGKLSKDQKHFLDIAKRNIDRLGRLIDDVLDFQKLNAGKLEFHMRDSSIVAVVEDAYNTMLPHARKNDVTLAMEVEPELPLVTFDYDRVIQVLQNLVSNAIKFTPQGGRVLVSAHRCDDSVALRITDTGCGIPKQDLSRIFEQFYRVTRPGREIKGTGLGLAIVNKIVAGHGGRIDVESEVDKGTTFSVVLPIRSSADPQKPSDDTDRSLEHLLTE
jgi:signal transduction histidine kinase